MRPFGEIDKEKRGIQIFTNPEIQESGTGQPSDFSTSQLADKITRLLSNSSSGEAVQADNRIIFPLLPDNCIDLILTDPPYKNYRSNRPMVNPKLPPILESDFDIPFFLEQSARVLKPGAHFYCWCDHKTFPGIVQELNRQRESAQCQKSPHFLEYRDCLIWVKNNHGSGNLKLWAPQHEFLLFASKGAAHKLKDGRKSNVLFKRNGREIQFYKKVNNYKFKHGTTKPVEILGLVIQAATNKGDLVMDPYAGTMSTAEACLRTGRRYLMVELVEDYYNTGLERIRRYKADLKPR